MNQVVDSATPAASKVAPEGFPRSAPVVVWAVWALMLLTALAYVALSPGNVPFFDGWVMVPFLTGAEPVTPAWLWEQHNEHRIPLPKLLLLALYRLSGNDFHAGMFFSVATLAGLAAALIRTARRLRGATDFSDAFFPLVLLNWGHCENFLWDWQVSYVVPTALAGVLLILIVRQGVGLTLGAAVLAGVCLTLLPLCGANGLLLVPALSLWLGWVAVARLRTPGAGAKVGGICTLALTGMAWAELGLYFVGYHNPRAHMPRTPLRTVIGGALQLLANGFGPATTRFWPYLAVALGLVLGLSAVLLLRSMRGEPAPQRARGWGLLLFLAAFSCLSLGIGTGRPGANFVNLRYVTLATPAWCGLYFLWMLCRPAGLAGAAQAGLFALAGLLVPLDTAKGIEYARHRGVPVRHFEQDLRDGVPTPVLLRRYSPALMPYSPDYGPARCTFPPTQTAHEYLTAHMDLLRRAGVRPFTSLRDGPPYTPVRVPVEAAAVHQMTWGQGTGRVTGTDPYLVLALRSPVYVCGVEIHFSYPHLEGGGSLGLGVAWKASRSDPFPETDQYAYAEWEAGAGPFWVFDQVAEIRLRPGGQPCDFQITEIVLLVPGTP